METNSRPTLDAEIERVAGLVARTTVTLRLQSLILSDLLAQAGRL